MKKRFLYTALPIAIVSLSMQSCFVAKNYDRPEVIDEPMYRTSKASQDTLSMANLPWKELFNELT